MSWAYGQANPPKKQILGLRIVTDCKASGGKNEIDEHEMQDFVYADNGITEFKYRIQSNIDNEGCDRLRLCDGGIVEIDGNGCVMYEIAGISG